MKLINTLDYPDRYLRRMISWICRELELPVRYVLEAKFQNTSKAYSGRCYGRRILVRIGPASRYPVAAWKQHRPGNYKPALQDRTEGLVKVTAHELAHVAQRRARSRTRPGGGWGGSEAATDALAASVLENFRRQREELLQAWTPAPQTEPVAPADPAMVKVHARYERVMKYLKHWEQRCQRAQRKVIEYRKKARYYEMRYDLQRPQAAVRRRKRRAKRASA